MLDTVAIFLTLTALFAYLNHKLIGLPTNIGVMGIALVLSAGLIGLDLVGIAMPHALEESLLRSIDFSEVLLQGMLSMLLFAGAMHVDLASLRSYRWQIGLLAIIGTTASSLIVGFAMWFLLPLVHLSLPLAYCLVFGVLISPTDPISVLGILKSSGAPESLEVVVTGESLFNDGVGIALFALAVTMATSGDAPTVGHGAHVLLKEGGGGIVYGLVLGYITFKLLKSINSYEVEVLITLASVIGGYALANHLGVSGPLAMVASGLIIGNHGRALAMTDETQRHVDMFWELLDAILNAVLFVLIGLEIVVIVFSAGLFKAAALSILTVVSARFLTAGLPVMLRQRWVELPAGAWQIMTWGGLRGGISVALALSLPNGGERDTILALTYGVVVFSILVQGLTIGPVVKKFGRGKG